VLLDEKRFQQVLLNYQSNALKFLDKKDPRINIIIQYVPVGGGDMAASHFKESVKDFYKYDLYQGFDSPSPIFDHGEKDKVVLSIIDNGVGIREEEKDKLFKLFGCLKSTQSMNTNGIGLGLVISKMISEEFGGRVQMHSVHG